MDGFVNETEWFFIPYMRVMVGMDSALSGFKQGRRWEIMRGICMQMAVQPNGLEDKAI